MTTVVCEEIWKDVAGWETYYQVSNLGKVKDIVTKKELETKMQGGHLRVTLYSNGVGVSKRVTTLVANSFLPPPPNNGRQGNRRGEYLIAYKDNNRYNVSATNLYWNQVSPSPRPTYSPTKIKVSFKRIKLARGKASLITVS